MAGMLVRAARMSVRAAVIVAAVSLLAPLPAGAQASLDHLTLIAPAAPGGGWDQTARAMQHALQAEGIVRVVEVENIPGAAGTIGLAHWRLAKAAPSSSSPGRCPVRCWSSRSSC